MSKSRAAFIGVFVLSAALNILLLGGSIYMMLIYDSVLPSHSVATLFGLLAMVMIVYAFQGLFDVLRSKMLLDIATSLDLAMSSRVQRAISFVALRGRTNGDGLTPMRDLDQIRTFLSGGGPGALMDLPWIFFFLAVLYLMHFWLGVTATIGAIVLGLLTWHGDRASRKQTEQLTRTASARNALAETNRRNIEVIQSLGMQTRLLGRWDATNHSFLGSQRQLANVTGTLGGISKVLRMLLQSMVLTVGALLVINGDATGGIIFASSILAARALAPVDQAIANWRGFVAARQGWKRLNGLLAQVPEPGQRTALPAPRDSLRVDGLAVVPPGSQRAAVVNATFALRAGDGLGIVGPSASGKSSLVRAIIGLWLPARGSVRLDGASIDNWDSDVLGQSIGYLPQQVQLLDGTVAENISRFDPNPDSQEIIAAATQAGVHEMILGLPNGYDAPVGPEGGELSAGQRQRIGLARALYRSPFLIVLDEPNSNLDAQGEESLDRAIAAARARGAVIIVVAHRPAALAQLSHVLFLREGTVDAFGPRDEVLGKILKKPERPPTPRMQQGV